MSKISLNISTPKEKLKAGESKLFGNPDVWDGFIWPSVSENGAEYDLSFMCQISCKHASAFDESGILPKTGMLYFFYDLDTMPELSDAGSARVLVYDGDLSFLHEMLLTDENGNSISFSEQKIDFEISDGNESPSALLPFGLSACNTDTYGLKGEIILLLRLCSFETEDAEIRFMENGFLDFYIEKSKLEAHDFSDVRAVQTAPQQNSVG